MIAWITHPDVVIDPAVPVPEWPLSERGRRRMMAMLAQDWVCDISAVYCSAEQKALDGAAILASHLGLEPKVRQDLGENDRSSTGYLPQDAFLAHVIRFFAEPNKSIEGWEPAQSAQNRVVEAVGQIAAQEGPDSHIAIVGHGGVGALLLTSLMGKSVSMDQEQPGTNGGNYFKFEVGVLRHGWRSIDG